MAQDFTMNTLPTTASLAPFAGGQIFVRGSYTFHATITVLGISNGILTVEHGQFAELSNNDATSQELRWLKKKVVATQLTIDTTLPVEIGANEVRFTTTFSESVTLMKPDDPRCLNFSDFSENDQLIVPNTLR
jgi:hypothetical protein